MPEALRTTSLEVYFNELAPFYVCAVAYGFLFVLACVSWLGWFEPLNRGAFWSLVLIALFFLVKVGAKIVGVYPLTRLFRYEPRVAWYTTMMMATGLTFGTISALFGLTHHYINQTQYTVLVTVVILSAVIPTLIAQRCFDPRAERAAAEIPTVPVAQED